MSLENKPNHIVVADKKTCCGCTSCYAACPKDAIRMCEDDEGFKYPVVDEGKCIECGLCMKRCPILVGNHNEKTAHLYAVKHKQEDDRAASSSGGVFSAIAQGIVDGGGVVYGAAYDQEFNVSHIRTEDHDWQKLRTSKYVQSDMGDTFARVKEDLKAGREVLFTGTPCQVDGLKSYLNGTDTTKLITCDLVCHGVPSPKIWKDFLKYTTEKCGKEIAKINFRNKKDWGWHNSTLRIESTDGAVIADQTQSEGFYFKLFLSHRILRPCCFSCLYANLNRPGDITIGDYWGVEKHHPDWDDDKGLSLVMANSSKGLDLIAKISDACKVLPVLEEECMQPNLKGPSVDYGGRDFFWQTYKKHGLEYAGKQIGVLNTNQWEHMWFLLSKVLYKMRRKVQSR